MVIGVPHELVRVSWINFKKVAIKAFSGAAGVSLLQREQ